MPMKVKAKKSAQHHQVALREVHDLGGLVDKDEAKRDQAVNAAERNAAHQLHERSPALPITPPPDALAILAIAFAASCVHALPGVVCAERAP